MEINCLRFVVLGANTPWVYALTEALAQRHPATAIAIYDWRTYYRNKVRWPASQMPSRLSRHLWLYPPGFLGSFRALFSRLLARRLERTLASAAGNTPQNMWLIAPYPWLAPPAIPVAWPNLIYYNLDDYAIYRPERATTTRRQEARTIRQSRLVICLAEKQMRQLRSCPGVRPDVVRHFPLGVTAELLAPEGVQVEADTVAYVGNLGDRVDWQLVVEVARSLTEVRFDFAGGLEEVTGSGTRSDWLRWRSDALRLPNVRHQPMVPQQEVVKYYWSAAINWIPYDVGHPFNIASCPTKIMDGLASGRPLLSAAVPECLLYPEHIAVFRSAIEATTQIQQHLTLHAQGLWKHRRTRQLAFARQNIWSERAAVLSDWLQSLPKK
jgi:glycosyltransferase involved in cell wall biosynthesis